MAKKRDSGKEPEMGDHVTWRSHGSQAEGEVEERITDRAEAAGRTVDASPRAGCRSVGDGRQGTRPVRPSTRRSQRRSTAPEGARR
jgi:hypothetical protein